MIYDFEKTKYFTSAEFDSPDIKGSGHLMKAEFMERLVRARKIAQIPFSINSGYRSKEYNKQLYAKMGKPVVNSAHTRGWAADIHTENLTDRYTILSALIEVGFTRIGIGKNFIHVDCDPSKNPSKIWIYAS